MAESIKLEKIKIKRVHIVLPLQSFCTFTSLFNLNISEWDRLRLVHEHTVEEHGLELSAPTDRTSSNST